MAFAQEVEKQVEEATTQDAIQAALSAIRKAVRAFVGRFAAPTDDLLADEERTAYKLENERTELLAKDALFAEELERTKSALARSREALMAHDETGRELRRRILDLAQAKAHEEGAVAKAEAREYELDFSLKY